MSEQLAKEKNKKDGEANKVSVKHFEQSVGYCGPASLKILFSHFGKGENYNEEQLGQLCAATHDAGTEHEGMIQAAKEIGGYVFTKENGTIEELEYFIKEEKLPVIIGWFDKERYHNGQLIKAGDHYSVVVSITDKNIIIVDPAVNEPERWIDRENFPRVWFDFVGTDNRVVSWEWYMVVTFEKRKFKVKGGYYY